MTHPHGDHEISRSLRKTKHLGYDDGAKVRDECLNYKNEGNDGKVGKLVCC